MATYPADAERLAERNLTPDIFDADLLLVLGHSFGANKAARYQDAAEELGVSWQTVQKMYYRAAPIGDSILIGMYGDAPGNKLGTAYQGEPKEWGPFTPPWKPDSAAAPVPPAATADRARAETHTPAAASANTPRAAGEPVEAAPVKVAAPPPFFPPLEEASVFTPALLLIDSEIAKAGERLRKLNEAREMFIELAA